MHEKLRIAIAGVGLFGLAAVLLWVLLGSLGDPPAARTTENLSNDTPPRPSVPQSGPSEKILSDKTEPRTSWADAHYESELQASDLEGEPESKGAEDSPDEPAENREVRIRLVDQDRQPVVGARFRYAGDVTLAARAMKNDGLVSDQWLTDVAITDGGGWFAVSVAKEAPLWLILDHQNLALVEPPSALPYTLPVNGWYVDGHTQRVVLQCDRSRSMLIDMQYEDGKPVTGKLIYSIWVGPGRGVGQGVTRTPISNVSQWVVDGLPPDARIWGHVLSEREGFAMKAVFRHDIRDGVRFTVTIPRSNAPRWGALVDLSLLSDDDQVEIHLLTRGGMHIAEVERRKGPGEYRTRNLAPLDGYQVHVVGKTVSWTSEVLNLSETPGEWRRLTVDPQRPVTVSLTVQTADGAPIHPAVVLRDARGYVNWSMPRLYARDEGRSTFMYATAGKDGQVTFSGLPAGRHSLAIEAQGFQRRVIEYSAVAGENRDLGTLVLNPFRPGVEGVVNVCLIGTENYGEYQVQLRSPEGGVLLAPLTFDDNGKVEIRGLHPRACRIEIFHRDSSKREIKYVDLEAERTAFIEVDASILK